MKIFEKQLETSNDVKLSSCQMWHILFNVIEKTHTVTPVTCTCVSFSVCVWMWRRGGREGVNEKGVWGGVGVNSLGNKSRCDRW